MTLHRLEFSAVTDRQPGLPVHLDDVLDRIRRGLPVFWPTDPKPIQQDIYIEYAKKRTGDENR